MSEIGDSQLLENYLNHTFFLLKGSKMPEEDEWTKEKFLESVREVNPGILEMQEEIYSAFEESEEVEIEGGEATYSFLVPSMDHKARVGIPADGRIMIGLSELSEREKRKLSSKFSDKLDVDIDLDKNWSEILQLGEDLKERDVEVFLEIILGE